MREPKKFKKRRKPMTPEQKAAAVERLAKARAARQKNAGPPKNVHPDVLALPDDATLSLKNVRDWVKTQQEMRPHLRKAVRMNEKGATARLAACEAYIRHLETYIRTGTYVDMFYGEHAEKKIKYVCRVPAYDKHGNMKYSHGVYYPSLGYVYGEEPEDE